MDSGETDATAAATDRERNPPKLLVRPFGYVADEPVIRRLGDRNLYLGNGLAADGTHHDRRFQYVLSATADERPLTTHHHPLDDALAVVHDARPHALPHPALHELAVVYLAARS